MWKSNSIWLWVIAFTPVLFSCITHNRRICKTIPPHQIVWVKIGGHDREFKIWTGVNSQIADLSYSYAFNPTTATRKEMIAAADYYNADLRPLLRGNQLASIVFYSGSGLDSKELKHESLLGILVYIRAKKKFTLHEYTYKNGSFTEIEAPASWTKYISTNDIYAGSTVFKPTPNIIAFTLQDFSLLGRKIP